MFGIFDLAFYKIVDPTIFVRDLFLFGALRARFFLCAGISVARRRQSTKSQVTAVSVNRGLPVRQSTKSQFARVPSRASSPRSRRSQSSRRAGKKSSRGEKESSRETTVARGEVAHDKESRKLRILKLSSHCAYAKMSSLVHQMLSLPKCISQMHNCWTSIFKIFNKILECIVQLHNCWRCSESRNPAFSYHRSPKVED